VLRQPGGALTPELSFGCSLLFKNSHYRRLKLSRTEQLDTSWAEEAGRRGGRWKPVLWDRYLFEYIVRQ